MLLRCFAILVLFSSVLPCRVLAANVISIPSVTARPGDEVRLHIALSSGIKGVGAVQLRLGFGDRTPSSAPPLVPLPADPSGRMYGEAKIELGPIVPTNVLSAARAGADEVEVGIVLLAPAGAVGIDGPGVLVSVPVRVPASAPVGTVYRLTLDVTVLNDTDVQPISANIDTGTLTVVSPHRLSVDGGDPRQPGKDIWVPVSFSSDTGAAVGSAVFGFAVVPSGGKPLPDVHVLGVVLDPALSGGSAYLMRLDTSSAIISVRSPSPTGSRGTLAHIRLRIPEGVPEGAVYKLVLNQPRVYIPSNEELPVSVQSGVLKIALRLADLNSDGRVDIMDVGLCLRYALGLLTPPSQTIIARADIEPKHGPGQYGDGVINISDVLRMLRVVLGFDIGY